MPRCCCAWTRVPEELLVLILLMVLVSYAADMVPTFVEEPESAVISHHASVTLPCKVAPPSAVVRWTYDGELIESGDVDSVTVQGNNLHIERFKHGRRKDSNEGVYQCIAATSMGAIVSRPAVLSKSVLKGFQNRKDLHLNVTEGYNVVLPCQPPVSIPIAKILFEINGTVIDNNDRYRILPSGSLLIVNTTVSRDQGQYKCIAVNAVTNRNRTASHVISLHVWNSSTAPIQEAAIITSYSSVTAREGESTVLECAAVGSPQPDISWKKYGGNLPEGRYQEEHGNLLIWDLNRGDGGTYVCHVNNGIGQLKVKTMTLKVLEPPLVRAENPHAVVKAAETVRLRCDATGQPMPKVTWYHNGEAVTRPQPGHPRGSVYVINEAEPSDSGLYQCMFTNDVGTAHAIIVVEVEGHPATTSDSLISNMDNSDNNGGNTLPLPSLPLDPDAVPPGDDLDGMNGGLGADNLPGKKGSGSGGRNRDKKRRQRKKKRRKKKKNRNNRKDQPTGTSKLVPPTKPDVNQLSDTSVMLNWTVPQNDGLPITFFRVQYKEVSPKKGPWKTEDDTIAGHIGMFEVSDLKPGGTYKFRIAAVYSNNDNRNGLNSNRFELHVAPVSQPKKPMSGPVIVEITPLQYKGIFALNIRWQYIPTDSSPIEGFFIHYKPYESPYDYKRQRLLGTEIRSHLITKLDPETEYTIQMQCFNAAGHSDFSNVVVKKTLGGDSLPYQPPSSGDSKPPRKPYIHKTPMHQPTAPVSQQPAVTEPPRRDEVDKSNTETNGEVLYMVLGIVLGVMMLLLIVFMFMCWWKNRQQRRLMFAMNDAVRNKFQDPSQRIYTDSMRKKYMNGGFALNGINGHAMSNGHLPHTYPKMNINVNPLSEVDPNIVTTDTESQRQYQPSTFLPNGTAVHHHPNSDTNCNNISRTKSLENSVHTHHDPSGHCLNNGDVVGGEEEPPSYPPSPHSKKVRSHEHYNCDSHERDSNRSCDQLSGSHDQVNGSCETALSNEGPGSGHLGKHKRRRRRPQSREQTTKDQATNTDLSSNEGTLEFSTFSKVSNSVDPIDTETNRTLDNHSPECSDCAMNENEGL